MSASINGFSYYSNTNDNNLVVSSLIVVEDTSLLGKLTVNGSTQFNGNLITQNDTVLNKLTVNNTSNFNTVNVNGTTSLKDSVLTGNLTISNDLNINGITNLKDEIVEGNSIINKILTVNGITNLKNTVLTGNLTVSGNTDLKNTNITGNIIATGARFNLAGEMTTPSRINAGGDLIVTGRGTIGPNHYGFQVTGNAICYSNFSVLQNLNVSGNTSISGNLFVSQNEIINKTLTVAGNTDLKNTNIGGNLTINQNLSVLGVSDLQNLNVMGNTTIFGNSNLKDTIIKGNLIIGSSIDGTSSTISDSRFDPNTLCIVGQGVAPNRKTRLYDNVVVDRNLTVSGGIITNPSITPTVLMIGGSYNLFIPSQIIVNKNSSTNIIPLSGIRGSFIGQFSMELQGPSSAIQNFKITIVFRNSSLFTYDVFKHTETFAYTTSTNIIYEKSYTFLLNINDALTDCFAILTWEGSPGNIPVLTHGIKLLRIW
jgi:hypothetical protein